MERNDMDKGATIKTWLQILREALIIVLVVVAVSFPEKTAAHFYKLGFNMVKTPWGDVDVARAAGGVEAARVNVSDSAAALRALSAELPQGVRERVDAVSSGLESANVQLQVPDQILTTAVRTQADVSGNAAPRQGWIYLGHVDDSKETWAPAPTIVTNPSPQFKVGEMVTVSDDVYIRAESDSAQRNQAPVIGVVRRGQQVKVLESSYTHALRGGWFMWLRVVAD
jgi:hypothetical protein